MIVIRSVRSVLFPKKNMQFIFFNYPMNHESFIITYGCHIATTTRGPLRRDPGALRNSLRKISLFFCPFLEDSRRMFGLVYSPWEQGYNKSPRVPRLSFPSSYRDSTFLSIFAVPNKAVFTITSNLTFTPIRFMYSLKLTDRAPRAPITTGTTMTSHAPQFCNFIFQWLVFLSCISLTSQVQVINYYYHYYY